MFSKVAKFFLNIVERTSYLGDIFLLKRKLEPEIPKVVLRSDKKFDFKTDGLFCEIVVELKNINDFF